MSFASHYHNLLSRLRVPAVLLVLLFACTFIYLHQRLPEVNASSDAIVPPSVTWSAQEPTIALDWSRFLAAGDGGSPGNPAFAEEFRFAGTFFLSDHNGNEIRKAVLGIVETGHQVIVSEGDGIGDVTVSKIFQERVVLRQGTEVAELWLSFTPRTHTDASASSAAVSGTPSFTSRFGETVGSNRWVYKRESLLDYYNELLDEPERLLQVFDSLKPLYNDTNKIEGYVLGVEGESDFFREVGLREGDIVRKVNSLEMTNRNRAEFFIRQVIQNQLSAVVIDVERNGEMTRLVYQVR